MIIALAGRRIDASDETTAHFPLANRALVSQRLHNVFTELDADILICSAACGGDLLALEAAEHLGIRRYIILPFDATLFRQQSVADRPGQWGPLFDKIVREAELEQRLTVVQGHGVGHGAYEAVTDVIIERAASIAKECHQVRGSAITAIGVWDMTARRPEDLTARFLAQAAAHGLPIREISTV